MFSNNLHHYHLRRDLSNTYICRTINIYLSSSAPALLCSNFYAQLSRSQFRNKRSRADVIISLHPPTTHPKLFKANIRQIIALYQLPFIIIRLRSTFYLHQPKSNVPFPVYHVQFLISKIPDS